MHQRHRRLVALQRVADRHLDEALGAERRHYNKETIYGDSPLDMAKSFKDAGATWIHMVDLDGAKDGKRVNDRFVIQSAKELNVNIQIGGGIRSEEDIVHYYKTG